MAAKRLRIAHQILVGSMGFSTDCSPLGSVTTLHKSRRAEREGGTGYVASRAQCHALSVAERLSAVETRLMRCIGVSERLLHKVDWLICVVSGVASALTEN